MLLEQIAGGKRFDTMAFAIAGWIRFMTGVDEAGIAIDGIKDPQVRPPAGLSCSSCGRRAAAVQPPRSRRAAAVQPPCSRHSTATCRHRVARC